MRVVLLITITFTLTLAHGYNESPCLHNAYNRFVQRHILQDNFDRGSKTEWKKYLQRKGLCGRNFIQSFIEKRDQRKVENICNGSGKQLGQSNLCMSDSTMQVYDVTVSQNGDCNVEELRNEQKKVIVASDKFANRCLPAHFERVTNQRPDQNAQTCNP